MGGPSDVSFLWHSDGAGAESSGTAGGHEIVPSYLL